MKLVDVSKCHEDSPDFRASLSQLEEAAILLEKRLKLIASLCEERQALNVKEREVTLKLIREFDLIGSSDPCLPTDGKEWDLALSSVENMTAAMKQLLDNQERMYDQINIGIVRPLRQFLSEDLEQLKARKKAYYKILHETHQITDKFGQCKKHELQLLTEIGLQLYDSRAELHKATSTYALELNFLHSKKTPDFLNRVVDFMMSQLSFFHLGHVTVKDVEPYITDIYGLIEKLRQQAISEDTQRRSLAQNKMEEVLHGRSQSLLHLYTNDLHTPFPAARDTISEHLLKNYSDSLTTKKRLDLPAKTSSGVRTKAGYMWYAEPKTFGIHWIRLYFYIKNGMLLSESTTKVRVPISLNLNLCNVKPAEVNDTERNFSFKVTSPVRVLLLQAEGSLEMQDWLETLGNAIAHAIHGAPPTSPTDVSSSASSVSSKLGITGEAGKHTEQDQLPVKPPRRKSNASKDLLAIPGNEVCAECGNSRPKWASVNLGILICIECSGIHRSLGVYVSQVRSLTLDSLKPSVLRRIKSIGNVKSNAVYEALLPKDFDRLQVRRPEIRKDFIVEKYVDMKYVLPPDKEKILAERKEARAESIRKSGYPVKEGSKAAATDGHLSPIEDKSSRPQSSASSKDEEEGASLLANTGDEGTVEPGTGQPAAADTGQPADTAEGGGAELEEVPPPPDPEGKQPNGSVEPTILTPNTDS